MLLLLLAALLTFAGPLAAANDPELVDRIVAVVDDQVILWSELNYRLRFELEQRGYAEYTSPARLADLRRQVLDDMIDEHVLVLRARKDSVMVDDREAEEMLGEQMRLVKSSMAEHEYKSMLVRLGLTERQLRNRYRKEITQRLLYRQLRAEVAYGIHVSRREVQAFREAHRDTLPDQISVSHVSINVRPAEQVLAEKRAVIERLQQRLLDGEDFGQLAASASQDPGTASQGGDLGCFGSGQVLPEFEEAAAALRPGEVSGPVLTQYGYHLIKLKEKREDALCASHILVRATSSEADRERVRAQLEDLRRRAMAGESFAQLARQYSQNRHTAMRGGLWDTFPKDSLPGFLAPHLEGLKLGEVCEPFFAENAGHIFRINDDQATLEQIIREQRTAEIMQRMIDEHRLEVHVERRLDDDFLRPPSDAALGYVP